MGIAVEKGTDVPRLTTNREPRTATTTKSNGLEAFDDALKIVIFAWVVIFLFVITLRSHIV